MLILLRYTRCLNPQASTHRHAYEAPPIGILVSRLGRSRFNGWRWHFPPSPPAQTGILCEWLLSDSLGITSIRRRVFDAVINIYTRDDTRVFEDTLHENKRWEMPPVFVSAWGILAVSHGRLYDNFQLLLRCVARSGDTPNNDWPVCPVARRFFWVTLYTINIWVSHYMMYTVLWEGNHRQEPPAVCTGDFFDSCSPLPFRYYLRRNCSWQIFVVECTAGLKSNKIDMGGFYPALARLASNRLT